MWRNQNYNNDHEMGGAWEDDDGALYSEEALQEEFAAKSQAQPGGTSSATGARTLAVGTGQSPQQPAGSTDRAQVSQSASGLPLGQNPGTSAPPPGDWFSQNAPALQQTADFTKWREKNYRRLDDGRWEGPDAYIYTDKDLRDIYEIDHKQWPKVVAQLAQSRGGTVTLSYPDGTIETLTGNHPQRDNNPGNIEAGHFTRGQGAIGGDQGFAIFPSPEAGWQALDALLKRGDYQAMNIDDAIAAYAPRKNKQGRIVNDTASYQRNVRDVVGVAGDTRLSELTPRQFEILKQKIGEIEGFNEARSGKRVKDVIQMPQRTNVLPQELGFNRSGRGSTYSEACDGTRLANCFLEGGQKYRRWQVLSARHL